MVSTVAKNSINLSSAYMDADSITKTLYLYNDQST